MASFQLSKHLVYNILIIAVFLDWLAVKTLQNHSSCTPKTLKNILFIFVLAKNEICNHHRHYFTQRILPPVQHSTYSLKSTSAHTIHAVQSLESAGKLCQVSNGIAPFAGAQTSSWARLSDEYGACRPGGKTWRDVVVVVGSTAHMYSNNRQTIIVSPLVQNVHADSLSERKLQTDFAFSIYLQTRALNVSRTHSLTYLQRANKERFPILKIISICPHQRGRASSSTMRRRT